VFVTSQGHADARFRRALLTKNVRLIDAAARELTRVSLEDALRILLVLAEKGARHVLTPTCSSMRSALSRRLTRTRFPAGRRPSRGRATHVDEELADRRRERL
jgi:hypothetical protein